MKKKFPGKRVFLVDGARTPFLKALGGPNAMTASDLAVYAGRALLTRMPFKPSELSEVILGSVMPSPDEVNIGRVVSQRLGCGKRVPGWTVQRNCASGLQAVECAALNIATGRSELVLAGGVDAMSHAPLLWREEMVRWLVAWRSAKSLPARLATLKGLRPAMLAPVIALLRGLTDPVAGLSMGQTAELLAERFGISRTDMDSFALRSHQRVAAAYDESRMPGVVPMIDPEGTIHEQDNGVRRDSSLEKLAKLKPAFDKPYGEVTPGNSAQVTDGAAWVLMAGEAAIKEYGLPVLAEVLDVQWAGVGPEEMGLGPAHAITALLQRQRAALGSIDYFEINEAFAAQVLACLRALASEAYSRSELGWKGAVGEIDEARLNVDGGAISIGHPVGASGARIALHLAHVLRREGAEHGIASLCIGGGQGGALLMSRAEELHHG